MRPTRLALQGFRSHRERTEIDFEGRRFTAIVGPTGAGKSSILDGIAYALYGKTPRVAAATSKLICSSCDSAEIELEFSVDGRAFTVARSIRRKGNSQHVLTDDAGEKTVGESAVGRRIEELLGLDFSAFCSSVLLPQGRFADFLEAAPTKRMQILKGVFRFEQIDAMREEAKATRSRLDLALAEIRGAREQVPTDVAERLKDAKALAKETKARSLLLEKALPKEKALVTAIDKADADIVQIETKLDELSEVLDNLPDVSTIEELAEREKDVVARTHSAEVAVKAAKKARDESVTKLEAAGSKHGTPAALTGLRAQAEMARSSRAAIDETASEIASLEKSSKRLKEEADATRGAEAEAIAERDGARATLRALERAHAAHAVRVTLAPGEPCPVCEKKVTKVPKTEAPEGFEEAAARETQTTKLVESARKATEKVVAAANAMAVKIEGLAERLGQDKERLETLSSTIEAKLGKVKDPIAEIDSRLELLERADLARTEAAAGYEDALEALETVRAEAAAQAGLREDIAGRLIGAAAALKIQPPKTSDQASVLAERARQAEEAASKALLAHRAKIDAAVEGRAAAEKGIEDLRKSLDLVADEPIEEAWREASADLGVQEAAVSHLQGQVTAARELEAKAKTVRAEHEVYSQLETDLRDSNFVSFLLEEKRRLLSELGSVQLKQLTGRYRFDDAGEFKIVDEFDADKVRTIDTLSGGETFLASLALSLALADAVTRHGGRLQCFFLDEGFGSLDPESLDLALEGIERIVNQDRLIGLVSHVKEMADRIEDKIVLEKTPSGTSVIVRGASLHA